MTSDRSPAPIDLVAERRWIPKLWIGLAVVVVVAVLPAVVIPWITNGPGAALGVLAIAAVMAAVVIVVILPTMLVGRRQCARMVRQVERLRPGWPLVLGQIPVGNYATAKSAAVVLVVLRDAVEVWGYGDTSPRWTVRRTPGGVRLVRSGGMTGSGVYDLEVSDGDQRVAIRPCDLRKLPWFPMSRQSDFADALTALGEKPQDHLVM
jgi:hypothetical protein